MISSVIAMTSGGVALDIGRGLREGLFMFVDTMWALVLGFGLSGAVQTFVPRAAMERQLGNHRPLAILRASLYGMASSSCSYAASAMAKSLFQKGADFVSSMVFMFASTNLVIELGLVLVVLIGWQFMAAEFVGGAIMVGLLALFGGVLLRGKTFQTASDRVNAARRESDLADDGATPLTERLRSSANWSAAARYTVADLKMLRREMVIGYGVAGFLAALVPVHVWNDLFVRGHGNATTLENVLVGPLIAILSFVCSIGNVPLAAALWKGGISFGGVISFIFADLITMPLLLVYKKLYGARMALRMLGLFWLVMSAAGLASEFIFRLLDIVPRTRSSTILAAHFAWNPTSALDLVFLALFAGILVLARRPPHPDASVTTAIDPVCGMQVLRANAPASVELDGELVLFCSDRCKDRFVADPARFGAFGSAATNPAQRLAAVALRDATVSPHGVEAQPDTVEDDRDSVLRMAIDPVCHMSVDPATAAATRSFHGADYYFCCEACAVAFEADPERYLPA